MRRSAREVARVPRAKVAGLWERHVSATYSSRALQGSAHGGRWGPANGFPVIYLGRPTASVVVEAYRHLVDPFEGMRTDYLQPRVLVACRKSIRRTCWTSAPRNTGFRSDSPTTTSCRRSATTTRVCRLGRSRTSSAATA